MPEAKKIKYYQVCIEGIDKAGKDSLWSMLDYLCNHWLSINVRGLMSNIAYDLIYNRSRDYDFSAYENVISIYLTADKDDWWTRCIATKEKDVVKSDYEKHLAMFNNAKDIMLKNGLTVFEYNTTEMTPYMIAKDILNKLISINGIDIK